MPFIVFQTSVGSASISSTGDWTQILGAFSSKGNIKAGMLSKLLLEAILLAEKTGLFVDFVSCDGATWNRRMWKSFGIGGKGSHT